MRLLVFLAVTAVVLAGLWIGFRPAPDAAPPAGPIRFELAVAGGQIEGPAVLKAQQGQDVQIVVRSDAADELHLHGYDLSAELRPGEPALLAFTAHRSGRFELELHRAHRGIGTLEVYPNQ